MMCNVVIWCGRWVSTDGDGIDVFVVPDEHDQNRIKSLTYRLIVVRFLVIIV